jgi:hypothetical protein
LRIVYAQASGKTVERIGNYSYMTEFWNWKFFLLILAANSLSGALYSIGRARLMGDMSPLPSWSWKPSVGGTIFSFLNIPLAWANVILLIAAFFWMPWLSVIVVFVCSFLVSVLVEVLLLKRIPLLLQLLLFYVAFASGLVLFFSH